MIKDEGRRYLYVSSMAEWPQVHLEEVLQAGKP